MNEKSYFKCFRLFLETGKKLDDSLKGKYYEALLEYGLNGVRPTDPIIDALLTSAMYSIDKSEEKQKRKSESMQGNSNAVKNWENISKQSETEQNRQEQKQTEKNIGRNKKNIEEYKKNIEDINNNIILTNDTETKVSECGNPEINNLISQLKQMCLGLGVAYDKTKERQFAKHILTAKEFGNFCEQIGQDRVTFALNVLKASFQIKFRRGICTGPMKIYQNYADVYNETLKQHVKNQKNLIQSF